MKLIPKMGTWPNIWHGLYIHKILQYLGATLQHYHPTDTIMFPWGPLITISSLME